MKEPINLITASVGGQGNILTSEVIGSACAASGLKITIGETHGLSQRGGSVTSYLRVSEHFQYGPVVPYGEAHVILGFEPLEAYKLFLSYGSKGTAILFNTRPNYPTTVLSGLQKYPPIEDIQQYLIGQGAKVVSLEATELARKAGNVLTMNIVMTGALCALGTLPIKKHAFEDVITQLFTEEKKEINFKAFELGYQAVAGLS